jgi:uncharacterized glyoxalase superfamily protein PhnB
VLLGILAAALIALVALFARRGSGTVSAEERLRRLDTAVGSWTAQGWAVESQAPDSAVLVRGGERLLRQRRPSRTGEHPTATEPEGAVKPNRSIPSPVVIPVLVYPDVREAVRWLGEAFGFEERLRIGENHRSQLKVGDGAVIVADVRREQRPPRPGEVTHSVLVRVEDARAHCERARSNGAQIVMEPTDFEYGERQYAAEDPAGHRSTFSETLEDADPAAWGGTLVQSD